MSEKRLWEYVRGGIGHSGHFDRIESTFTVNGRPDVNYCIDGRIGDVELKVYDKKRGGFIIRSSQIAWFRSRIANKGLCFILARYDYSEAGKIFLLIPGENAHHLTHDRSFEGWKNQAKLIWANTINWSELKAVLKG